MDLFNNNIETNILPYEGTVIYYGKKISASEAAKYFSVLMETIEWKNDEAIIFGKHIITKRKVAWYGDANFVYTYSNIEKQALSWTKQLLELKELAENITGEKYNSCLLNLYHNGSEGMAWHSDDEKALAANGSIASFSFGAERNFLFRNKKNKQSVSVFLEAGSLLEMKDDTQKNWLHRLPPATKVKGARINLTFRKMLQ